MQLKNILPNCRFFDTYSPENIPTGAVQCADSSKCSQCGFNPVVHTIRLEKVREQIRKRKCYAEKIYKKQGGNKP